MKWIKNRVDIDKIRNMQCSMLECKCYGTGVCDGFHAEVIINT